MDILTHNPFFTFLIFILGFFFFVNTTLTLGICVSYFTVNVLFHLNEIHFIENEYFNHSILTCSDFDIYQLDIYQFDDVDTTNIILQMLTIFYASEVEN